MAGALKILDQVNPAATTDTALYTVPALTQALVSSLIVCNQSATPATFRIALRKAGLALTAKQYLYYDTPIQGNDTLVLTAGIGLATTDIISVYASSTSLSFTATGQEIT